VGRVHASSVFEIMDEERKECHTSRTSILE